MAKLLIGMSERLKERAMYRKNRRQRLRYREPRFNNRTRKEGWLAPSVLHKLDSHIRFIAKLQQVLPITKTIIEVANFDAQKIANPTIEGVDYQEGEQKDFWNLREYILHRDGHQCQNQHCKNSDKQPILEVHHLGFWKQDRSDRPGNLITLCSKCHTSRNHQPNGFLYGWEPKVKTLRGATFMSMVRWKLVNHLESDHTYGYETKSKRIAFGIEKSHHNDAFVIASGNEQSRSKVNSFEQVKRNNRSLERFYDAKVMDIRTGEVACGQALACGRRTRNVNQNSENLRLYRGETISKGRRSIRKQRYKFQPKDFVRMERSVYTVKGVQNKGAYIRLVELSKPVRTDRVCAYRYSKGFVCM